LILLPGGREMIESIIRYACPTIEIEKILSLEDIQGYLTLLLIISSSYFISTIIRNPFINSIYTSGVYLRSFPLLSLNVIVIGWCWNRLTSGAWWYCSKKSRYRHDSYSANPFGTLFDGKIPRFPLSLGLILRAGIQSILIVKHS